MIIATEEKQLSELKRIAEIFQEQRNALNAEGIRVTERISAWHARRARIDDALERLRNRLKPVS